MTSQPADIDKILAQEVAREKYRQDYNARPDVQEKRKEYNKRRQEQSKIARRFMKGEITEAEAKRLLEESEKAPMASAPAASPAPAAQEPSDPPAESGSEAPAASGGRRNQG